MIRVLLSSLSPSETRFCSPFFLLCDEEGVTAGAAREVFGHDVLDESNRSNATYPCRRSQSWFLWRNRIPQNDRYSGAGVKEKRIAELSTFTSLRVSLLYFGPCWWYTNILLLLLLLFLQGISKGRP